MKKIKCYNCVFYDGAFCSLTGRFIVNETRYRKCSAYEEEDPDYDGMDLTDSEIYILGELSSQDSEAW